MTGDPVQDFAGAQFGLMSNLRTGNMIVDTAICLLIPFVFGIIFRQLESLRVWWDTTGQYSLGRFINRTQEYRRVIVFERLTNTWGQEIHSGSSMNNILQKSISLYLEEKKLRMNRGSLTLMTLHHNRNNYYYDDSERDADSPADQLSKYRMACEPETNTWTEIQPGLYFCKTEVENDTQGNSNITKTTITYTLKCSEPDGDERIKKFLDGAYQYYQDELRKQQDDSRYFYNLLSGPVASGGGDEGGGGNAGAVRTYKRYKLSDEKSFRSIFFPEKEQLMTLLKHFGEKTGKYAIEGYPHKLGLLLHGPPGTGKTSLIKCMAQHTKRHIVSIPLSRIKTNQELMDLVFDQVFNVVGEDMPVRLKFKDVIFVMEDVDAASSIVHSRKSVTTSTTLKITRETSVGLPKSHSHAGIDHIMHTPVSGAEGSSLARDLSASHLGGEPAKEVMLRQETIMELGAGDDSDSDDDSSSKKLLDVQTQEDAELAKALMKPSDKPEKDKKFGKDDKLDLAGLLNVLDGVIDSPGRILIMTSNHPEKLDPALIRPGRIDKRILLGYLNADCAVQMISHYFSKELTEQEKAETRRIFACGPMLTPAVVEQLCAEHETVAEFLVALAKAGRASRFSEPKMGVPQSL